MGWGIYSSADCVICETVNKPKKVRLMCIGLRTPGNSLAGVLHLHVVPRLTLPN